MHHSITLNELDEEVHKFQGREPSGRQFGEMVLDSNSNNVIFVWLSTILGLLLPAVCIFFKQSAYYEPCLKWYYDSKTDYIKIYEYVTQTLSQQITKILANTGISLLL